MLPVGNRDGIPCGPFYQSDLDHADWEAEYSYWTGGQAPVFAASVLARLAVMKVNNQEMILGLQGGSLGWLTDGEFDFSKWQARADGVYAQGIESYIEDGTIIGNYLIDEPKNVNAWGGVRVANNVIDDMGAYSKSLWPTLPAIVRHEPLYLTAYATADGQPWPGGDYVWEHVDGAWAQYTPFKPASAGGSEVNGYIAANYDSAQAQGLSLVVGMNWRDGGLGESGVQSVQASSLRWCTSPGELDTFSTALLSPYDISAWYMWKLVDAIDESAVTQPPLHQVLEYWNSAPVRASFDRLLARCAAKERRPLLRRLG